MDDGVAISYKVLPRGTPVMTKDGEAIGKVERVLDNPGEEIFDGIVIRTKHSERFVDAPEVARIAERAVTLTITAEEASNLPEPDAGAPQFRADPAASGGRMRRLFGGGPWKRR